MAAAGFFYWSTAQGQGLQPSTPDRSQADSAASDAAAASASDRSGFAVDPSKTGWNYAATADKIVYLTFDDGPSVNTRKILDILDRYNCKATFFVTGLNPDYAGMIKTAYDDGNTIGLHSYTHDYAKVYASDDAFFADIDAIGAVVKEQIGYVPCFVRFAGGSSNTISAKYSSGIMTRLSKELLSRGYQYYDWNSSAGDGADHTAAEIATYATSVDYNNIIILCHDANGKETTVDALPSIIEHYKALGYSFKAIDRSSVVPHQKIAN